MIIEERTLSSIIDTEFREFSMYTIENRAIPSVIDGFKPTQRKLVYAMLTDYANSDFPKVAELGGAIAKYNYHHGEVAAMGSAVTLAQSWNNILPVFQEDGNFGSRLVPVPGQPRYIYVGLSNNFKKFFIDEEVAPPNKDPDNPEPAFYLPIIPWVLLNGIEGIAVGFKTVILSRSAQDLIDATNECIKNPEKFLQEDKPIKPTIPKFKGEIELIEKNKWKISGVIEVKNTTNLYISELPIGWDRLKYLEFLESLYKTGKIADYEDDCSKVGFGFKIKVTNEQYKSIADDLHKFFKLTTNVSEIFTTLDENNELKIFNSPAEIVYYFVKYRTTKFADKIKYDSNKLETVLNELTPRIQFIKDVIDNKIDFRKNTKSQLLDYVKNNITKEEFGKKLINIPLYECTVDEITLLENKIVDLTEQLRINNELVPIDVYKQKLKGIKL